MLEVICCHVPHTGTISNKYLLLVTCYLLLAHRRYCPPLYNKLNDMKGVLGHRCAHAGYTGPGKPPQDGEIMIIQEQKREI